MITRLRVDNFKSLKGIDVTFTPLSFFVGANASGKSNFANALDFISNIARENLPYAVSEKGGYYNISHRAKRRARGAVSFFIDGLIENEGGEDLHYSLEFQLRSHGEDIRAEYFVSGERLILKELRRNSENGMQEQIVQVTRTTEATGEVRYQFSFDPKVTETDLKPVRERRMIDDVDLLRRVYNDSKLAADPQNLLISGIFKSFGVLSVVNQDLEGIRVFQINSRAARQPSSPSVKGDLGRRGENLASAIDRMRSSEPEKFTELTEWVRDVVPSIKDIEVGYTETKQLGLFFQESGYGSRWFAEDMSDGTIMSVAIFFALIDKRYTFVVIEEPENALHPWILRKFIERCREVAKTKQVLLTTHSPLVVSKADVAELFIVDRIGTATNIVSATQKDGEIGNIINGNFLDLGAFWLSGGVGGIPDVPDLSQYELFDRSDNQ